MLPISIPGGLPTPATNGVVTGPTPNEVLEAAETVASAVEEAVQQVVQDPSTAPDAVEEMANVTTQEVEELADEVPAQPAGLVVIPGPSGLQSPSSSGPTTAGVVATGAPSPNPQVGPVTPSTIITVGATPQPATTNPSVPTLVTTGGTGCMTTTAGNVCSGGGGGSTTGQATPSATTGGQLGDGEETKIAVPAPVVAGTEASAAAQPEQEPASPAETAERMQIDALARSGGRDATPEPSTAFPRPAPAPPTTPAPAGAAVPDAQFPPGAERAFMATATAVAVGILARLLGLTPLVTRRRRNLLMQETRAQIHELVQKEPGIHVNRILEQLELGSGQVLHHLAVLEKGGLVRHEEMGGYRCYFVQGDQAWDLRHALRAVKAEAARTIVGQLASGPVSTMAELRRRTGLSRRVVEYHVQKLAQVGLLEALNEDGRRAWRLTEKGEQTYVVFQNGNGTHGDAAGCVA